MKKLIVDTSVKVCFAETYAGICNDYSNLDSDVSFRKREVRAILRANGFKGQYVSRDKSFYEEYNLANNTTVRFTLNYKYGYIEAFYAIWNDSERIIGRFNSIAMLQSDLFDRAATSPFPSASSESELRDILIRLLKLNHKFISAL